MRRFRFRGSVGSAAAPAARGFVAVVAALAVSLSLLTAPAVGAAGTGPFSQEPQHRLAWLAFGSGVFSVDAGARTIRYRACDGDTGRVLDPKMTIAEGVAAGQVTVDGATYHYEIPLRGRERGLVTVARPHRPIERLFGDVVTDPQPATDPARGAGLLPLTDRLREVVEAAPVVAGVAVRDLSGRYGHQQIAVNGDVRPKAASVIKLWILTELLRRVDCGEAALTDGVLVSPADVVGGSGELQHETFPQVVSLHRLAEYMIKYSDNTAANVLIDYLGGFGPVNALIDSMNQRETILARKLLDTEAAARGEENFLSVDDVMSLLRAVWEGDILSPASRDLMIQFMREQTIDTKIPAALPPGVPVAHKTGELPDISHDVGYYLLPDEPIAVAFVTSGPETDGDETVRQLARTVYDFLEDRGKPSRGATSDPDPPSG